MRMLRQSLIKLLFTAVVYVTFAATEEYFTEVPVSITPTFSTKPANLYVNKGQTVSLECKGEGFEHFGLYWKKGKDSIFLDGERLISDSRFNIVNETTLTIAKFDKGDEGEYSCLLSTSPHPTVLIHKVHLKSPPKIINADPVPGDTEIQEGSKLSLTCAAEGRPPPKIRWTSEEMELSFHGSGKVVNHGNTLHFDSIKLSDEGQYECTAVTDMETSDPVVYRIKVLAKPVITIEQDQHTMGGNKIKLMLTCKVKADPPPQISWIRSGNMITLTSNSRYELKNSSQHYLTLIIKDAQPSDYGDYICIAKNDFGTTDKTHKVTGLPSRVEIDSSPISNKETSYELRFSTQSAELIDMYHLVLCVVTPRTINRNCNEVNIPGDRNQLPPRFSHSYNIEGLMGNSTYQVVLRAKNEYGWSPEMEPFVFSTSGALAATSPPADATPKDIMQKVEVTTEPDKGQPSQLTNQSNGAPSLELQQRARVVAIMTVVILVAFF